MCSNKSCLTVWAVFGILVRLCIWRSMISWSKSGRVQLIDTQFPCQLTVDGHAAKILMNMQQRRASYSHMKAWRKCHRNIIKKIHVIGTISSTTNTSSVIPYGFHFSYFIARERASLELIRTMTHLHVWFPSWQLSLSPWAWLKLKQCLPVR